MPQKRKNKANSETNDQLTQETTELVSEQATPQEAQLEQSHEDVLPLPSQDEDITTASSIEDDPESMLAYQSLMRHRKQRRRKKIIGAAIAGVCVLGALGAFALSRMQQNAESEMPIIQTYPVTRGEFSESVSAQGSLKPISSYVVTPEVEGIIETLNIQEGSTVEKDDVLLTLKNDELDKAVNEALLNVRTAENNVQTAKNALSAAEKAAREGDSSGLADARIGVDQANLALDSANEAYQAALVNSAKRVVLAPEAGEVIVMNAVLGQSVGAGSQSSSSSSNLIQIADLSQMTVTVQVNELDISKIEVGQEAKVSFSAVPDLELDARVERISTVSGSGEEIGGNYGVVSYPVDLVITTPDPRLKPGMTATVYIMMQYIEDVLTVPATALNYDENGKAFVSVVIDPETSESEIRPVEVIAKSSTTVAISGDISEEDMVELSYMPQEGELTDEVAF